MSTALADGDVDHVVLERGGVADTWRHQRWDSFRLNTPDWMNTVLGKVEPDSFSTRDEVVELLSAKAAALPVLLHTPVVSLDHDGSRFVVRTPAEEVQAATVVLASGMQNVAKIPGVAGRLPTPLRQIHAADYRSAARLPSGAALVVGSAQSGSQIAEDLVRAGRRVYLSTSRVGWLPWFHRGRELLGWLLDSGYWRQRPQDLEDPSVMRAAQPIVASGGRSLNLPILSRLGVTLVGRIEAVEGPQVMFDDSVVANVAFSDQGAARLRGVADAFIDRLGIEAPPPESDTEGGPVEQHVLGVLDLDEADVSCVIWCTGFTGDFSWVRLPVLDEERRPRHSGCASAVPGLWFVGFPWLTSRQSGILYGFPEDAASVASAVKRYLGWHAGGLPPVTPPSLR